LFQMTLVDSRHLMKLKCTFYNIFIYLLFFVYLILTIIHEVWFVCRVRSPQLASE